MENDLKDHFLVINTLFEEEFRESEIIEDLRKENEQLRIILERRYTHEKIERDRKIIELHHAGVSRNGIARQLNMSPQGINRIRKALRLI